MQSVLPKAYQYYCSSAICTLHRLGSFEQPQCFLKVLNKNVIKTSTVALLGCILLTFWVSSLMRKHLSNMLPMIGGKWHRLSMSERFYDQSVCWQITALHRPGRCPDSPLSTICKGVQQCAVDFIWLLSFLILKCKADQELWTSCQPSTLDVTPLVGHYECVTDLQWWLLQLSECYLLTVELVPNEL